MPHPCPIEGCTRLVADDKLMCFPDWKRVPTDIAREVYHQYRRQPHSAAHLAACAAAVDAANDSLKGNGTTQP